MAEGLINHDLKGRVQAFSAGVRPKGVNPRAIQVMAELGIDISHHYSKTVADLPEKNFDLVITVCDRAAEECPFFPGPTEVLHVGFPDPAQASGSAEEMLAVFRQVRDEMRRQLVPLVAAKAAAKGV